MEGMSSITTPRLLSHTSTSHYDHLARPSIPTSPAHLLQLQHAPQSALGHPHLMLTPILLLAAWATGPVHCDISSNTWRASSAMLGTSPNCFDRLSSGLPPLSHTSPIRRHRWPNFTGVYKTSTTHFIIVFPSPDRSSSSSALVHLTHHNYHPHLLLLHQPPPPPPLPYQQTLHPSLPPSPPRLSSQRRRARMSAIIITDLQQSQIPYRSELQSPTPISSSTDRLLFTFEVDDTTLPLPRPCPQPLLQSQWNLPPPPPPLLLQPLPLAYHTRGIP